VASLLPSWFSGGSKGREWKKELIAPKRLLSKTGRLACRDIFLVKLNEKIKEYFSRV